MHCASMFATKVHNQYCRVMIDSKFNSQLWQNDVDRAQKVIKE